MRTIHRSAIAAIVAAVFMIGSPTAQAGDGVIADASERAAGLTAGQLLGEEFRQLFKLPPGENPILGNGGNDQKCLSTGRKNKILILWTTPQTAGQPTVCDVKPGTPLFFSTLFAECSSVEAPPFFGVTEAEQRRCALDFIHSTPFDAILVKIDNRPEANIGRDSFLAVSGQVTVQLPNPNIFDSDNRQATFVAAAYSALIRPLPPGSHEIAVTIIGGPFAGTNRAEINVGHK